MVTQPDVDAIGRLTPPSSLASLHRSLVADLHDQFARGRLLLAKIHAGTAKSQIIAIDESRATSSAQLARLGRSWQHEARL